MMTSYKLRTLDFFTDVAKVPKMFLKRKLALIPHFSRAARRAVRRVFQRAEEE